MTRTPLVVRPSMCPSGFFHLVAFSWGKKTEQTNSSLFVYCCIQLNDNKWCSRKQYGRLFCQLRYRLGSPQGRCFWTNQSLQRRCERCKGGCAHTPLCRQTVKWCWAQWTGPPPPLTLRSCRSPQSQLGFPWSVRSARTGGGDGWGVLRRMVQPLLPKPALSGLLRTCNIWCSLFLPNLGMKGGGFGLTVY